MASTISPNMLLILPTIGSEPGPAWASDQNSSFTIIDSHNHSTGQGVQIQPSGLNINSDLPINANNLTIVRSVNFKAQTTALSLPTDIGCLYVAGVDLYYNDESGNQIRLTQGGSIVGTAGSITGLPSGTASASYAGGTFVWQSATSTAANMDFASAILRNNTAGSFGLTLSPPNAMSANYNLVLPSLPSQTSIMALDVYGNITAPYTVDNSTIVISTGVIKVPAGGITSTQIAAQTVAVSNLVLNPRVFYYASANAASSPTGSINFDTAVYDVGVGSPSVTASAPGTGTWKFTNNTGAVGYFRISGIVAITTAGHLTISLYVNGSAYCPVGFVLQEGYGFFAGTVKLNAGDYMDVRFSTGEVAAGNALLSGSPTSISIEQF